MSTDEAIREVALLPQYSYIVQAPAGSGKTGLLTQRLLCLLASVVTEPEQCLAITFTRKAAREMKDRLLAALQRAKDPNPPLEVYERSTWTLARQVLQRDKTLGWDLLHNASRLKIQTIDAFCASLTKQMPIVSQMGNLPNIVEDPSALYLVAAEQVIKSIETQEKWSNAVRILLLHLDNNLNLTQRLLAEMLSHRDQWLPYLGIRFSTKKVRQALDQSLERVVLNAMEILTASIPKNLREILECAAFAANELLLMQSDSEIRACANLTLQWPGAALSDFPVWLGLGELLLTQEQELRKTVTVKQGFRAPSQSKSLDSTLNTFDKAYYQAMKSKMLSCLEHLEQYPDFLENLRNIRECPPLKYTDDEWQVVAALAEILPILTAELAVVFQERGEVDFTEMTLAALRALGENEAPTDLALGLDYKIHHILVDEFQDTSLSQFRLLEKLTLGWQPNDGRTLFLVGDPMQSIYRFRQAEVGLFIKAKQQGVGDIPLKFLQLQANFRSDPSIVTWITNYFQDRFPKQDDLTTGAVVFHVAKAALNSDPTAKAALEQVSSATVGTRIASIVEQHRTIDPEGSMALLVRSRTHLQEILPTLRLLNIEYQGVDLERLEDRRVVQDLFMLTRALLHLGDRIAWLALLRGPWSPLSLKDLWCIANFDSEMPIFHALQSYLQLSELSVTSKKYLEGLVEVLTVALKVQGRVSLREWVELTWRALAGLSSGVINLVELLDSADAMAFLEVLEQQDQQRNYAMVDLEARLQKLYASTSPSTSNQVLQIMTIHKAKGLEFDTVIVPGVEKRTLSDPSRLLLWEEGISLGGNYFLLAPIKAVGSNTNRIYTYLRKQEKLRAEYEATRLAYVAATRARKRLHWIVYETEQITDFEINNHLEL